MLWRRRTYKPITCSRTCSDLKEKRTIFQHWYCRIVDRLDSSLRVSVAVNGRKFNLSGKLLELCSAGHWRRTRYGHGSRWPVQFPPTSPQDPGPTNTGFGPAGHANEKTYININALSSFFRCRFFFFSGDGTTH